MAVAIYENQTFSGTVSDADGDVFINCTFQPGTTVNGDGIRLLDCTMNGTTSNPISFPGTGTVIVGGSSNHVTYGPATVVDVTHTSNNTTFGPDSNVRGDMFTFEKPVVDTNMPCNQKVEGEKPAEVREVCWNMRRENEDQSTEGSRTG